MISATTTMITRSTTRTLRPLFIRTYLGSTTTASTPTSAASTNMSDTTTTTAATTAAAATSQENYTTFQSDKAHHQVAPLTNPMYYVPQGTTNSSSTASIFTPSVNAIFDD